MDDQPIASYELSMDDRQISMKLSMIIHKDLQITRGWSKDIYGLSVDNPKTSIGKKYGENNECMFRRFLSHLSAKIMDK